METIYGQWLHQGHHSFIRFERDGYDIEVYPIRDNHAALLYRWEVRCHGLIIKTGTTRSGPSGHGSGRDVYLAAMDHGMRAINLNRLTNNTESDEING
jgi:hypothetical protein